MQTMPIKLKMGEDNLDNFPEFARTCFVLEGIFMTFILLFV